jgi:hypothetical protein
VTSAAGISELSGSTPAGSTEPKPTSEEIEQEDKPRSRIVAEYLAHGYVIGDTAIQRAIELDTKHGISARFTAALSNFDNKVKATDKAKAIDSSYGVTDKGMTAWRGANSYFEKALGTPTGQKLAAFYTTSEKQVIDIHTEARRLADIKKQHEGTAAREPPAAAAPAESTTTLASEKTG